MPQPTKGPRLGGSPAHQRLILANLATSLFEHGRITTTEAKARKLRPYAERLITKAKVGDLHNRREIQKVIRDKTVVHRLIADIGPFFADRQGGYTRITKTLPRKGDNAPMAVIELVSQKTVTDEAERARRVSASQSAPTAAAPAATESSESSEADVAAEAADEAADKALDAAVAADDAAPGSAAAEGALDAAEAASDAADATADAAAEENAAEEKAAGENAAGENAAGENAAGENAAGENAAEESASTDEAPYGAGSHAPLADPQEAPSGFPVKGNADSMIYHVPESAHYSRTVAEVWFASPGEAEAAGFRAPGGQASEDES